MKKMKVLIAYDGSECAKAALEDLKRAGLPEKTDILVISVADVFLPPAGASEVSIPESIVSQIEVSRALAREMVNKAGALAEEGAKKVRAAFSHWNVRSEGFGDSPAWGILKKAEEWRPDLIIIGAHGMASTGRLLLGSISQRVAIDAPCSVRIVRRKPEEVDSPLRIVIGVDGSAASSEAIKVVASRNWRKPVAVHVVMGIDPKILTSIFSSEKSLSKWRGTDEKDTKWIERMLEDAENNLALEGFYVTSLNKKGDPKKILLEEAERWGADCIFVGARGLNGIRHQLTGSVSSALAARAHCTVEIVRPPMPAAIESSPKRETSQVELEAYD